MESIWNGMEWYGIVHGIIWNSPWNSPWIPYGMGLYQKISPSPIWNLCSFHGLHGPFHLDSIWNRYLELAKFNLIYIYIGYI